MPRKIEDRVKHLILGKNVQINTNVVILCHHRITIGDRTMIGPNCTIVDFDHLLTPGDKRADGKSGEIWIGQDCWIGANSVILKGVNLGSNCVVGAGSVVTHSFPDNSLIMGNPAKHIKYLV